MSDELNRFGTGERGTFKVQAPEYEAAPVLNKEILDRDLECGIWIYDFVRQELMPYQRAKKEKTHYIVTDEIPPTEYLGNTEGGEYYTSKKKLEERTHRDGFFIPTLAERKRMKPLSQHRTEFVPDDEYRRKMREDWERASNDVKYGNVEFSEQEKQQCREEERRYRTEKRRWKALGC